MYKVLNSLCSFSLKKVCQTVSSTKQKLLLSGEGGGGGKGVVFVDISRAATMFRKI